MLLYVLIKQNFHKNEPNFTAQLESQFLIDNEKRCRPPSDPNDWKNPLDKWKTQIILYNRKKSSCHRNNHLKPSQFQCPHQLLRLPACQLFLDMFVMAFPWVVTFAPAWVTHLHPMLLTLVCVCLKLCLRLVDAAISTNHNWQSSVFFWWRLGTPNRPHYCLFILMLSRLHVRIVTLHRLRIASSTSFNVHLALVRKMVTLCASAMSNWCWRLPANCWLLELMPCATHSRLWRGFDSVSLRLPPPLLSFRFQLHVCFCGRWFLLLFFCFISTFGTCIRILAPSLFTLRSSPCL